MKKQIVIVGGGAAGWMTSLYIQQMYKDTADITLIESEEIGILGAGEGSIPGLIDFLTTLNINTFDFFIKTNATHKIGISFENWNGDGKKYMHDFFGTDIELNPTAKQEYLGYLLKNNLSLDEYVLSKSFAYSNKSPILLDGTDFSTHSFHFDAHLMAAYFRAVAESRGVKRIEGITKDFKLDKYNNVSEVYMSDGKIINCDFIFDCTGFARLIIGGVYGGKWISYKDKLTVNSAIPFFLPQSIDHIKPYTKAIAMKYGWMWQIPLQNRWGCGYVFDDNYIDSEQAKAEVEYGLGHTIDVNRTIKFEAGRFASPWINNCVAIGNSSTFIEPLEATAIGMAIISLTQIKKFYIDYRDYSTIANYNLFLGETNDDITDFLQFHYITKRNDTPFWDYYRNENNYSNRLKKYIKSLKKDLSLEKSKTLMSIFTEEGWKVVGLGLGILDKDLFIKKTEQLNQQNYYEYHNQLVDLLKLAKEKSISELDFINKLKKEYGKS